VVATGVPTQSVGIPEQITAAHPGRFSASSAEDTPDESIFHLRDASVLTPGQAMEMAIIGAARAVGMENDLGSREAGRNPDRSLTSHGVVLP
jgi:hypothetical protein